MAFIETVIICLLFNINLFLSLLFQQREGKHYKNKNKARKREKDESVGKRSISIISQPANSCSQRGSQPNPITEREIFTKDLPLHSPPTAAYPPSTPPPPSFAAYLFAVLSFGNGDVTWFPAKRKGSGLKVANRSSLDKKNSTYS